MHPCKLGIKRIAITKDISIFLTSFTPVSYFSNNYVNSFNSCQRIVCHLYSNVNQLQQVSSMLSL